MKKIYLLLVSLVLMSCPTPSITVNTVNAPEVILSDGTSTVEPGYYQVPITMSISSGYGGNISYSLNNGTNWQGYSSPVLLSPSTTSYKVVSKQTDSSGNVSGISLMKEVVVDSSPTLFSSLVSLPTSGAYMKNKDIYVAPKPALTTQYTLDGGLTWTSLSTGNPVVPININGSYSFQVRWVNSSGVVAFPATPIVPVSIIIDKNPKFPTPKLNPYDDVHTNLAFEGVDSNLTFKYDLHHPDNTWTTYPSSAYVINDAYTILGQYVDSDGTTLLDTVGWSMDCTFYHILDKIDTSDFSGQLFQEGAILESSRAHFTLLEGGNPPTFALSWSDTLIPKLNIEVEYTFNFNDPYPTWKSFVRYSYMGGPFRFQTSDYAIVPYSGGMVPITFSTRLRAINSGATMTIVSPVNLTIDGTK